MASEQINPKNLSPQDTRIYNFLMNHTWNLQTNIVNIYNSNMVLAIPIMRVTYMCDITRKG